MVHAAFCEVVTNALIVYGAFSFARALAKFFWR